MHLRVDLTRSQTLGLNRLNLSAVRSLALSHAKKTTFRGAERAMQGHNLLAPPVGRLAAPSQVVRPPWQFQVLPLAPEGQHLKRVPN